MVVLRIETIKNKNKQDAVIAFTRASGDEEIKWQESGDTPVDRVAKGT